jgi:hypothetical protein
MCEVCTSRRQTNFAKKHFVRWILLSVITIWLLIYLVNRTLLLKIWWGAQHSAQTEARYGYVSVIIGGALTWLSLVCLATRHDPIFGDWDKDAASPISSALGVVLGILLLICGAINLTNAAKRDE